MLHIGQRFDAPIRPMDTVTLTYSAEVVALKIDEHQMFCDFFGRRGHLDAQGEILFLSRSSCACSFDRPRRNHTIPQAQKTLGGGGGDCPTVVCEVQPGGVWSGVAARHSQESQPWIVAHRPLPSAPVIELVEMSAADRFADSLDRSRVLGIALTLRHSRPRHRGYLDLLRLLKCCCW